jgi:hypothetical protein
MEEAEEDQVPQVLGIEIVRVQPCLELPLQHGPP